MYKVLTILTLILLCNFADADLNQSSSCTTNSPWNQNQLTVADGGNDTIDESFRPFDFAIDSQHNIYVTDSDHKRILMYPNNYTIGQMPTIVVSNVTCEALCLDHYDNLYFVDLNSIKILNRTTGNVTLFADSYYSTSFNAYRPIGFPSDLYIDTNSRLYALESGARVIRFLLEQPSNSTLVISRGTDLNVFKCIFIDETDNNAIYICTSPPTSKIVKFTNDGSNWTMIVDDKTLAGNSSTNISMYFDSLIVDSLNQQLYILDGINNRVIQWSLLNKTQPGQIIIQLSNTTSPNRIRLDKEKNLYVSLIDDNNNGRIIKFINCNPNQTTIMSTSTTMSTSTITATTTMIYTSLTTITSTTTIANSTSNAVMNSIVRNNVTSIFLSIIMILNSLYFTI